MYPLRKREIVWNNGENISFTCGLNYNIRQAYVMWVCVKIIRWIIVASAIPLLPPVLGAIVGACLLGLIVSEFI